MSEVSISEAGIAEAAALEKASAASVGDFLALLKPRVMSLVLFTALVGMAIAPGSLHPVLSATALLAIALGAGAAGALNMWFDADIDALMSRTRRRPVPMGRIGRADALAFGAVLAFFSVLLMALAANPLAAALLALTIGFYLFVYTMWLKRKTPQNIVIGGAAGALPPLVGWAAVTGDVALAPIVLFLIIFVWTPPHFWALALYRGGDYAKAGVPMLPVVAGARKTCEQILLYTLILVPLSLGAGLARLCRCALCGRRLGERRRALGACLCVVARARRARSARASRAAALRLLHSLSGASLRRAARGAHGGAARLRAPLDMTLSEEEERQRRKRNLAIAAVLVAFVVLVFVVTIVRLGGNVLQQPS